MSEQESSEQESAATRRHASTGPAGPQLPEPSHAERTRTLVSLVSIGTLSTMSRRQPGFPFGSPRDKASVPRSRFGHPSVMSADSSRR